MNKEIKIKQLSEQIKMFKQFMSKSRKQQVEIIKQLENALTILKKQKD